MRKIIYFVIVLMNLVFPIIAEGLPLTGKVIVIDPGHDSKHNSEKNEQYYTLEASRLLAVYLIQQGATVKLTRYDERCPSPEVKDYLECATMRGEIASGYNPDYFISLHYNDKPGSQVYYHRNKDYKDYANDVLTYLRASVGTVANKAGKGKNIGGGLFQYTYNVLDAISNNAEEGIDIPSILLEICGKIETGIMSSKNGWDRTARDIVNGILAYIGTGVFYPLPGNGHPDDNASVSGSSLLSSDITYEGRSLVNVLFQGYYNELESLLNSKSQSTLLYPVDIDGGIDRLKETSVFVIPSGGLYGLSDSSLFRTQLEEYVKSGGTIVCFSQQHGYDFNVLPRGNEITAYGWLEDQNCQNASVNISIDHPMFAGQTTNTPNVNVDGYFTKYPADATVLLTRTKNLYPAMLMYPYGQGKVVITSMYSDWAYGHGFASSDEISIVRDLISWAKNTEKAIPTVAPGESVTVPVEVKYSLLVGETQAVATKVVFTILDPDRNIIETQEQAVNITPGASVTGTVPIGTVPSAKQGIWWIDYTLYDANGNIVQEQTEGDRFAISVPRTPGVAPASWQIWAVSSDSYVAKGSNIVLTVFVKNNSTTDLVNGSIVIGAHQARAEGGAWWIDLISIPNVTIPAGTERSFTYTTRIDYSSSFYIYLFDRPVGSVPYFPEVPSGLIVSAQRGVWVVAANVSTTVSTDKVTYKRGDVANVSVNLKNLQNANYNLTSQVRIFNPNNVVVFQQNYAINLPANSQSTIPITFGIGETIGDGIYVISVETFEGVNRVSTGASTFEVQNIRLSLLANIPSAISPDASTEVSFNITNTGIIDVVNAPLIVTLKDPNNSVLYRETKYFSLAIGAIGTISFSIPSFSLNFGNHTLTYNIEYGAKLIFGMEVLNCSNSVSLEFDKTVYAVRDTINMNLRITNTGRFNEAINVNVRADAIGLNDTRGVNILAGQSISIPYSSIIPEVIESGTYPVVGTLSSGNNVILTFNFIVPESKLVANLDKLNYVAGEVVSIGIKNIGSKDTTGSFSLILADSESKVLYKITDADLGLVLAGATTNIGFNIPQESITGNYILNLEVKNNRNNELTFLKKNLIITGIQVDMVSQTDKQIYLSTENITALSNLANTGLSISGANLNLKIRGSIIEDKWETFLIGENIVSIVVDGNKVWLSSYNKLFVYDKTTNTFQLVLQIDGRSYNISSISVDNRYVWLATSMPDWLAVAGGMIRYDKTDGSVRYYDQQNSGLIGNQLTSIAVDGDDVWMGSYMTPQRVSINKYNKVTDTWTNYNITYLPGVWHTRCIAVSKDEIWFGVDWNGVVRYIKSEDRFEKLEIPSPGMSIKIDGNYVWIGSSGNGLYRYDKVNKTWRSWTTTDGLSSNRVVSVAVDGSEVYIWCGFYQYTGKVNRYDKNTDTFKVYNLPANKEVAINGITADGNTVWFALGGYGDVYRLTSGTGTEGVVWTKDIPIDLGVNEVKDINTVVGNLGITGKFYLDSILSSSLNQTIAKTIYPFYIVSGTISLGFSTDKKTYKPNETITIIGEVKNAGEVDAQNLNLILKAEDTVIYTETFNLSANSSHQFTATTTSANSFMLTGTVSAVVVSEQITVEAPIVNMEVSVPSIVGRSPFNIDILLTNTGKIDANLNLSIAGEDQTVITLPVGQSKLISKVMSITQDTIVDIILSGDVTKTIQKQISFGEVASVSISTVQIYSEGIITLPYSIANTGSLDTSVDATFTLTKNNQFIQTLTKTHLVQVSKTITDNLTLTNLSEGDYKLSYTSFFEKKEINFKVGKFNKASLLVDLGNFANGSYPLTIKVKNTGVNEFTGVLRITNKFLSAEEEISLLLNEEKTYIYSIIPKGNAAGVYAVKIEVLFAGNTVASETKDITLIGPVFTFVSLPSNLIFDAGSTNTLTFRVKNIGDLESQADLKLVVFDTLEQTKSVWLKPNEEADISFTFPVPEDMPDGDYSNICKATLNNATTDLKLHINGIKLSVSSGLDKEMYLEGETAQFSVNVTNLTAGIFNLRAGVQFNEYSASKDFALGTGTQTIVFSVPVKFTGQKLTYGIYFVSSGRSIYLDSVYVNKKQDVITLTTDKQLYNPGESVLIKIESTQAGVISITAPNYTQTQDISIGTTTLSFTLAENMIAGTYAIEYTFAGVNYKYPFDVAGLIVRILEVKLDKPKPAPGEQITLSLTSDSNKDITPTTLKGWLIDASGITAEVFSESIYLIKGENKFSSTFTLATTSAGIHRIIYGIYDANNILLVSGSKSFDVGTATLLGCSTDKIDYPLGTEQVNAIVTLFGQSGVNTTLTIYLDDNFILTQNITTTGATQETTIPIQVQTPGWHIVKADLNTDGLVSSKETRFIYGSSLPDLTISSADIIIEHPLTEFSGIQYDIEAKVYNVGKQNANNVNVRFYDGNPDSGGLYIGETTIQKITGKSGSAVAKVRWDATGKEGEHTIFVLVNPDKSILELDTTNNQASKNITVYKVWMKHWEGDFVGTGSIGGPKDRHKIYNYNTKRLGRVNLVKVAVKVLVKEYENDGSEMTDKINPYLEVWSMEKQKKEKGRWKCFRFGRWVDTHQINGSITPIDIGWYKFSSVDPEVLNDVADEKHDHIDLWIKSLDAGKSDVKHSKDKVKIDKVILEIEYE